MNIYIFFSVLYRDLKIVRKINAIGRLGGPYSEKP